MIAACPKCQTRYRVQPEQLGPDGARLRCSSCNAVFRVRAPAPSSPSPERSALADAARAGTTPASGAAEGRGARSEPKASGAPQDASNSRQVHRNDGLEGRRSDRPADLPRLEARRSDPAADLDRAADLADELPADRHAEESAEPGPSYDHERLVIVAHADPDASKGVADALEAWGLQTLVAHDGVEAMLAIQRALPRAVVLDAALPRMYGFQVCEIVKRNESLRDIRVVLVGAIHKEERYRRAPRELYGADVYVEPPDLPDALLEILSRFGLPVRADSGPSPAPVRPDGRYGHVSRGGSGGPAREPRTEPLLGEASIAREAPGQEPGREAVPRPSAQVGRPASGAAAGRGARSPQGAEGAAQRAEGERSASGGQASEAPKDVPKARQFHRDGGLEGRRPDPVAKPGAPIAAKPASPADPLAAERAKAERLARIIVSDIVLYNPEKFAAAARAGGDVAAAMRDELEEGRSLFRERIDPQVRGERDHLAEELNRAAKARSGR